MSSSSRGEQMGVLPPPSSMFAIFGVPGATLANRCISSFDCSASMNSASAPASANAAARHSASSRFSALLGAREDYAIPARALVALVARGADARDGVRPGDHAAVARVPAGGTARPGPPSGRRANPARAYPRTVRLAFMALP